MQPDVMYQFLTQRHAEDIAKANHARRIQEARQATESTNHTQPEPTPRPRYV